MTIVLKHHPCYLALTVPRPHMDFPETYIITFICRDGEYIPAIVFM